MKFFAVSFAVIALFALCECEVALEEAAGQPRYTCDVMEGILGNVACNQHCKWLNREFGMCVEGTCTCGDPPTAPCVPETRAPKGDTSIRCTILGGVLGTMLCNFECRKLDFDGGVCCSNRTYCTCYGPHTLEA